MPECGPYEIGAKIQSVPDISFLLKDLPDSLSMLEHKMHKNILLNVCNNRTQFFLLLILFQEEAAAATYGIYPLHSSQ